MDKYMIKSWAGYTYAVDYKGVQIIQNPVNGGWMLFFDKKEKYANQSPFAGTLAQMKKIINDAIKIGKGGEKYLLKEKTYTYEGERIE